MNDYNSERREYKIIAVFDTIEDTLVQQSLELAAFAESFTSGNMSRTLVVIPGRSAVEICETISAKYGIDTAALEHERLYLPDPELLSDILSLVIGEYKPEMVVFTHTMRNCQISSKLAVTLAASSVTAVESFKEDDEGYIFRRSIFNGKLRMNVRSLDGLKIATVLPGAYSFSFNGVPFNNSPSVIRKNYALIAAQTEAGGKCGFIGYEPLSLYSETDGSVKLEDADVIVSAGRGIGKEENLELVSETAAIFSNSAVGASRPICDQRWLPFNRQVGITGKTVSPKLYIACGISGSQQHIAGMKNSQCIVAINKDPNAAIFSVADYCVIEDIISFLPLLVKTYKDRHWK